MGSIFASQIHLFPMAKANVYYFNPTCELAVANGSFSYMPPLLLQEMERDLAALPFVFATKNDFVLTENTPSPQFIKKLTGLGFELPAFCSLSELEAMPSGSFDAVCPWGWSPAAHFKLKKLKEKCSAEFQSSPVFNWTEEHRLLFERSASLNLLGKILDDNPDSPFISKTMIGERVSSFEEIENLLQDHAAIVLKAPMSASGRGIQIIRRKVLNTPNSQWISGTLKQQNYLIAEPFLEKLADLSFQFQVSGNSEINYTGYSIFETNTNGQYKSTLIYPDLKRIFPEENPPKLNEMIRITADVIRENLKNSVYSRFHRGYLGVDALIFGNEGNLMLQPCVEVNCRMNMGALVQALEKKIDWRSAGKFELFYGETGNFGAFASKKTGSDKVEFQNGKIISGFVPLIEPDPEKKFGAYASLGVAK